MTVDRKIALHTFKTSKIGTSHYRDHCSNVKKERNGIRIASHEQAAVSMFCINFPNTVGMVMVTSSQIETNDLLFSHTSTNNINMAKTCVLFFVCSKKLDI
jgi:hypothetical protein